MNLLLFINYKVNSYCIKSVINAVAMTEVWLVVFGGLAVAASEAAAGS